MSDIRVFENPWPDRKRPESLEESAVKHAQLVEIFLKMLPHFETDEKGEITDEALVYSEWRYINYMRFLEAMGHAPVDFPPPWDVAMIWYLHLLSPTRFHEFTWTSKSLFVRNIYGLEYRHFPVTELLKGEWRPKWVRRVWDKWSSLTGLRKGGPNLSYQLWPSPPWEEAGAPQKSPSGNLISRLFDRRKSRDLQPGPHKIVKQPGAGEAPQPHLELERPIIMQTWNKCAIGPVQKGPTTWDITSYTNFRTCRRAERCKSQSHHEEFHLMCELAPWPTIHDLRAELNRQIPFWRILTQVKSAQPNFDNQIRNAVSDYKAFVMLFKGKWSVDPYVSRHDPKTLAEVQQRRSEQERSFGDKEPPPPYPRRAITLLPPTLEVDVLWRAHRLFPGNYWIYTSLNAGWVLDNQPVPAGTTAEQAWLTITRREWAEVYKRNCPTNNSLDQWFGEYVPDGARFGPRDAERRDLRLMIKGREPWRGKRYNRTRDGFSAGYAGGGGGGSGDVTGGGGCGDGGGGDGGGGGGGGGDGGG